MVSSSWVDTMLIGYNFPKLRKKLINNLTHFCANLIATLTRLNMHYLPHFEYEWGQN